MQPLTEIHVLGTGGTIVSRQTAHGGTQAADSVEELLRRTGLNLNVTSEEVVHINSFRLRYRQMRLISEAVDRACSDPKKSGVVITHGTDTMEETAFFLDLVHRHEQPVVITGAQRAADMANTDGPENLRQAALAAASTDLQGTGVSISFESEVYAARHTRKLHTLNPGPFAGGAHVASVQGQTLYPDAMPRREAPLPIPSERFDSVRIHVIDGSPETSTDILAWAVNDEQADGIVIVGVGAGNAPEDFAVWVEKAHERGLPVVLATRVPAGPVAAIYSGGRGGAVDLVRAGAISAEMLNPYSAKVLLALLVSLGYTGEELAKEFHRYASF